MMSDFLNVPDDGEVKPGDFDFLLDDPARKAAAKVRQAPANPDAYAQAVLTGKLIGVPAPVVARNPDIANSRKLAQDIAFLSKQSPSLGAWLGADDNALVAHDDLDNLGAFASLFGSAANTAEGRKALALNAVGDQYRNIAGGYVESFLGGGWSGLGRLAENKGRELQTPTFGEDADEGDVIAELAGMAMEQSGGFVREGGDLIKRVGGRIKAPKERQGIAAEVQAGLGQLAGQASSGGFGTAAMVGQGADIAGTRADEAGATQEQQAKAAEAGAIVTGLSERLGLGFLMRQLPGWAKKKLSGRAVDIAMGGAGEGTQEAIEGIGHDLIASEYDPNTKIGEGIANDFTVAGLVGLIARGAVHAHGRVQQIEQSEQDAKTLEGIAKLASESKLAQRSPEHMASLIAELKAQGGPQEAYLTGEDFVGFFQSEEEACTAAAAMTGQPDALAVALESQGDIAIPMEKFVPFLATNPEAWKKARTAPENLSPDDVGKLDREAEVQQIIREMVAGIKPDTAPDAGIEAQLAPFYKPAEAKAMASLIPRFYEGIARLTQRTAEEVRAQYPVEVVAARLVGPQLEQAPDSPEFRNWFGDSKVVDAEGKPLVVYHGTDEQFDAFDPEKVGSNYGLDKMGFFFSDDRDSANRSRKSYPQKSKFYFTEADKAAAASGRVIEAFVTIRNPLTPTGVPGWQSSMGTSAVNLYDLNRDAIEAELATGKYDGFIMKAEGRHIVVPLSPTQIKSATGNRGTFDPNDPSILNQPADGDTKSPRGAIQFPKEGIGSGTSLIHLAATKDRSTFLHEAGHFFLEVLSNEPKASGEFQKVLDWFGVADPAAWAALDLEGKRPHHEKFARGFEQYLGEGKAPSPSLRTAFRKFKRWIVGVYKDLAVLKTDLSDDVRGVFDRLLAAEYEIEAAAEQQGYTAAIPVEQAASLGLSESALIDYRNAIEKAKEALAAKLLAVELRKKQAAYKAEVKAEMERLRPALADLPVYLLRDTIKSGRKLDAEATQLAAAFLAPGRLSEDSKARLAGYTMQGGIQPEAMADLFGYKSADAMLDDLINAPSLDVLVREQAESLVLQKHGDPLPQARQLAMDALHNSRLAQAMNAELKVLAQLAGDAYYADPKVVAEAAKRVIARTTLRNLRPHQYLVAERKAANEAAKFAAKGKFADALKAKQAQAFNAALYREARAAEQEGEKARKFLAKFDKRPVQQRLGKTGHRDGINALLEAHDLRKLTNKKIDRRASLAAWIAEQEVKGVTVDLPARLMGDVARKPFATLTVEEVRELRDAVKYIDHLSRRWNKLLLAGEWRDREAIDAEMADSVRAGNAERPDRFGDPTVGDTARKAMLQVRALQGAATDLARELDGFKDGGGVWAHTVQVIREALFGKTNPALESAQTTLAETYRAHFTKAELRGLKTRRTIPGVPGSWSRERVLSLALNWGNDGNRKAILEQAKSRLTPEQVSALLNTLSAKDWGFVQSVWKQIDAYWPQIAEAQQRRTGIAPEKVQATPFTVMVDGQALTLPGGYYPLKYEADSTKRAGEETANFYEEIRTGKAAKAATRRGHTEERVGSGGRTVALDLGVIEGHLRSVIRDLALGDAVNYVHNVLHGEKFTDAVGDVGMVEIHRALETWLKDVAAGETTSAQWWDKASRVIRQNFTAAVLTYKVSSAALQVTGYVQTSVVLGKHHAAVGLKRFLSHPIATARYVNDASPYMADRGKTTVEAVQEVNSARMGSLAAGRSAMIRWGYFMIGRMQRTVDLATWLGAESKGLELFPGDIKKARAYADDVVSRSQGSQDFTDKSALLRGTWGENIRQSEVLRACMVLQSYMMAKGNAAYARTKVTDFRKPGQAMHWAADMALLFAVEGMIATVIRSGIPDDDDDDGLLDEAGALFFREGAANAFGSLPGMGTAVSELRGYDAKGVMANAWGSVGDAIEQTHQGELDKAAIKATTNLSGFAFGVPSSQINKTIDAIDASQEGQQVYPYQYVTGVPKD